MNRNVLLARVGETAARSFQVPDGPNGYDKVVFSPDGKLVATAALFGAWAPDGTPRPGAAVLRTADGVPVLGIPDVTSHVGFVSNDTLARAEPDGVTTYWCSAP